jgi:hypothetical protein
MILTFLGNRYQRSETTVEVNPIQHEGMYRGNRYTVNSIQAQPAKNVQLCYRGIPYDR